MTISDSKLKLMSDKEIKVLCEITSYCYNVAGFDYDGALWDEMDELQRTVAFECQSRFLEYVEQKEKLDQRDVDKEFVISVVRN